MYVGADTPVAVVAVVEDEVNDNDGIDDDDDGSFVVVAVDGATWTPTMFPSCIMVGDSIELPFENFVGVVGSCWIIVVVFLTSCGTLSRSATRLGCP